MKFMLSILIFLLILTCSFKTFAMQIKDTTGYPNGIKVKTGTDVFGYNRVYKNKAYGKQKMIKEDNYKNSYVELDKYYYVIYKYDKILDGVVSYLGDYHKNEAGNKFIFTYTYTNSETLGYEENFKKTNSTSAGIELKSGIDVRAFEAASQISTDVCQSEEIGLNISKTYTNTCGYTLTYETSIKDYDTYYHFEKRALFDVYKVDIYELVYYKEEDVL